MKVKLIAVLRRRAILVVALVVLTSGVAAAMAGRHAETYQASGVLVVSPTSPGQLPPGNPDGAVKLARTYAQVLPASDALMTGVSSKTGVPARTVRRHFTVTNDQGTAVVRIGFDGASARQAIEVVNESALLLTGVGPPAPVIRGSLSIVQMPHSVLAVGTTVSRGAQLGALLGLVLGALLALAFERSEGRLDRAADVTRLFRCPVTEWRRTNRTLVEALVHRWSVIADTAGPRIALVGVGADNQSGARCVADEIVALGSDTAPHLRVVDVVDERLRSRAAAWATLGGDSSSADGEDETAPVLMPASLMGTLGDQDEAEVLAQVSDMTVLVVTQGVKSRVVEDALARLSQFGVRPAWIVLIQPDVARADRPARRDVLGRLMTW